MQNLIEQIENTVRERVQNGAYSIAVIFGDDTVNVRAYQDHHFTETFITPNPEGAQYDADEAATTFAAQQPGGAGMSIHRRGRLAEIREIPRAVKAGNG